MIMKRLEKFGELLGIAIWPGYDSIKDLMANWQRLLNKERLGISKTQVQSMKES